MPDARHWHALPCAHAGLTLLGSTHVALAAGLAAMCCRRQRAYVARRELLASGAALHLAFLVRAFCELHARACPARCRASLLPPT